MVNGMNGRDRTKVETPDMEMVQLTLTDHKLVEHPLNNRPEEKYRKDFL